MKALTEQGTSTLWLISSAVAVLVALIVLALVWRALRQRRGSLASQLARISYDTMVDKVLPKADDGYIHVDLILLLADGVLVVDAKDVRGTVFGSDRMQEWTVIDGERRRFTFPNPQSALYDRVAAVRQVLKNIPVEGKLIFAAGAEFTKGQPSDVATIDALLAEYPAADRRNPPQSLTAFRQEWQALKSLSVTL